MIPINLNLRIVHRSSHFHLMSSIPISERTRQGPRELHSSPMGWNWQLWPKSFESSHFGSHPSVRNDSDVLREIAKYGQLDCFPSILFISQSLGVHTTVQIIFENWGIQ